MKHYIQSTEASRVLQINPTLTYPDSEQNIELFPLIAPVQVDGTLCSTAPPSKLITESVARFGREPKDILDIGCGMGRAALYLASLGHKVTAIDVDKNGTDWAKDRANQLGIPDKNFVTKTGTIQDLSTTERYDGIISEMTLHMLNPDKIQSAILKMKSLTRTHGLNIVSAYTTENPEQEKTIRGLHYFFEPNELAQFYKDDWRLYRNTESLYWKALDRSFIAEGLVLIPTVAEVIAQKGLKVSTKQKQVQYMDAQRQLKARN